MKLGDTAWALWRGDKWATPFQSPAWLNAWAEHLAGGELLIAEAPGRALLPLILWDDQGVRKLVPAGAGQSDYCDMIGDADAVPALLAAVAELPGAWDTLVLPDLRPGSPLLGPLPPGWSATDESHEVCPVLKLPPDKSLTGILPGPQRRKLAMNRNRAQALGGVTVGLATIGELPEALEALIALHKARWTAAGKPGVLGDPKVQAFLRTAALALAAADLLRIAIVRHLGRIVAVLLAFKDAERFHAYISGVDFSVPKQSFGTLGLACLIEAAIAEGMREFHFLRGQEAYKFDWGAEPVRTVRRTVRRTG